MEETKLVVSLSNKELEEEVTRLLALPIPRDLKKNVRRKKKERTPEEEQAMILKALGISQDEYMNMKTRKIILDGIQKENENKT